MRNKPTSIVFVVNSIPAAYGIKFKALLRLARMLQKDGRSISVATYDYDVSARDSFESILSSEGLRGINLFSLHEYFSQKAFPPLGGEKPGLHARQLDAATIDYYDSRKRLCKREIMDEVSKTVIETLFYAPGNDTPYLTCLNDASGVVSSALWTREDGTTREFKTWKELQEYWIAHVANSVSRRPLRRKRDLVFIAEDHALDRALLSNRFAKKGYAVINHVCNSLFGEPYTFGSPLSNAKYHLSRARLYDAVVFHTAQEMTDAAKIFGSYPHMLYAPPACEVYARKWRPQEKRGALALHVSDSALAGARDVLDAFAKVADEFSELTLEIYGSEGNREKLGEYAASINIDSRRIRFFPGWKLNEALPKCIGFFSVVSHSGFDYRTLEALSYGIAVISFDYRYGPADIIRDGENGYIVSPGDIQGLECAMRRATEASSDNDMAERRRNSAQAIFNRAQHQWETALSLAIFNAQRRIDAPVETCIALRRIQIATESRTVEGDTVRWRLLMKAERSMPRIADAPEGDTRTLPIAYSLVVGNCTPEDYRARIQVPGSTLRRNGSTDYVRFDLECPLSLLEQTDPEEASGSGSNNLHVMMSIGKTKSRYSLQAADVLQSVPAGWSLPPIIYPVERAR